MKRIEIDDDIYTYIAANTEHIGESASDILRRLLHLQGSGESGKSVASSVESKTASALHSAQQNNQHSNGQPASDKISDGNAKVVFNVLTEADLAAEKSVVGRFLHILSMLYRCHPSAFDSVLEIKGRDRVYFAISEQALLLAGKSTNPKQIPDSPYWVITNNNTTRKKSMLTEVAANLGYSAADVEKIRDFL